MRLTNSFEVGVSGTVIDEDHNEQLDTGDGWDAFTGLGPGTGTPQAQRYCDSDKTIDGDVSMRVVTGATLGFCFVEWTDSFIEDPGGGPLTGGVLEHWGRCFVWFESNPSSNARFVEYVNDSITTRGRILLSTTGHLVITDATPAFIWTSSNAIPLGQFIRVEWHIVHDDTAGVFEIAYWANASETGAANESASLTSQDMGSDGASHARFGVVSGPTEYGLWMDTVEVADNDDEPPPAGLDDGWFSTLLASSSYQTIPGNIIKVV